MKTAIWWIRRDLRLKDNQALMAALSSANLVVPVFVLDPKLINSTNSSARRLAFLYNGLSDLDEQLRLDALEQPLRRADGVGDQQAVLG